MRVPALGGSLKNNESSHRSIVLKPRIQPTDHPKFQPNPNPVIQMKPKKILFRPFSAAAFATLAFAMSSSVNAQSWDAGAGSRNWSTAANWSGDTLPAFDNVTDISYTANVTSPFFNTQMEADRTIRSLTIGGSTTTNFGIGGGASISYNLTFGGAGGAAITIQSGAAGVVTLGNISIGSQLTGIILAENLLITHNGAANLNLNRPVSGTSFGITKEGTGTAVLGASNTFTGGVTVNGGVLQLSGANLIAGAINVTNARLNAAANISAGDDLDSASEINLSGGTLAITHGTFDQSKTYNGAAININSNPSTITWQNIIGGTTTLTFSGANAFAVNADLTIDNLHTATTVNQLITLSRPITGSGDVIIKTNNNISSSSSSNYTLGRVAFNADNSAWTGDLIVAEGTASITTASAANSSGSSTTGQIVIGETGNAHGAGIILGAGNAIHTIVRNITVRQGGFRSIKGTGDGFYILDGDIALEGSLNMDLNFSANDRRIQVFGDVSGVGGLDFTESGVGQLFRLTGNNTYQGATTINTSVDLRVTNGNGIGNASAVTFAGAGASLTLETESLPVVETVGSIASAGAVGTINLEANTLTTGGDNANTSFGGAISGTITSGLTKVGNGIFTLTGVNTLTGVINVNAGTLVAGRAGNADIGTTSAVNLNGGNLVFQPSAAFDKTYNGGINVISAGILSYDNPNNTTHTLTLGGADLALNANLTVKNTSDVETLVNPINISRLITGSGDLIVETYNNIVSNLDSFSLGRVSLGGNNTGWNGNLRIARGTVSLFGNSTTNAPGNGTITIGTDGDTFGAGLTFFTSAANTYSNNITVNPGGFRAIKGGGSDFNITFAGNMTLDGNLTVDHFFPSSERRINLNGPISGTGGLTVTRAGGSLETTLRMAGANTYEGGTTVTSTASLALASTASLASNVVVQGGGRIGGPGTINANLTLNDTANFFFYAVGSTPGTFVPMTVTGTVTLNNTFSVANIVGGSRGEVVDWDQTPDGTYTLIASTPSSLSNIQNFGSVNYATIPVGTNNSIPRYAYFQGTTGLQIVVSSTPPVVADPFTTWSDGAAFNDDTNNDGIGNGLAFLLGAADVDENANGLLPAPTQNGGALTLTFKMRDDRGAASLQVQHSSDLGITDLWSTLVTVPGATSTVGGIDFTVGGTPPLLDVTATIPAAGNAANGRLFGRVKSNQ